MTDTKRTLDAYELAMLKCREVGIVGLTRALIKKPYMGIFYGQGWRTFSEPMNFDGKQGHDPRLLDILQSIPGCEFNEETGETVLEAQAKVFHKAIESSFGNMAALRKGIKAAHYEYTEDDIIMYTDRPTCHNMGDGTFVAMDYKVKTDINGVVESFDTEMPDVTIKMAGFEHTFEKMSFKTKEHDLVAHGRSGFVNLIQATDALVARHIVANMGDLGAQHTIAVHDCFRTNINDFLSGKLHRAIERAYDTIFTEKTTENGDILRNYFNAVEQAGSTKTYCSQGRMFNNDGSAKLGDDVEEICYSLENGATYFSK